MSLLLVTPTALVHPAAGLCAPTLVCPSQIIDAGSGLAKSVASQAASSVLDAVGAGMTQAAGWTVGQVMHLITSSTEPAVGARWFLPELGLMEQVALLLVLPVLLAATVGPVLHQDARRLFRVWGVGLPVALFSGLLASQVVGFALRVSDAMSSMVTGPHSEHLGDQFVAAMGGPTVAGVPLIFQMIVALLALAGSIMLWLELTVRSAGVYVATFFMPLVLVAYIWPATAGLAKRTAEVLAALILAKFVILASISLGLTALQQGGLDSPLSGAAILLMAGFAPYSLLRLAPVVEAAAIGHLEGMSRRPGRAAARTVTAAAGAPVHPVTQLVMSAAAGARSAAGGADGGGGGGGDGGIGVRAVAAQRLPQARADYPTGPSAAGPSTPGPSDA